MGVPALFQWVFYRFPKAVKSAKKPQAEGNPQVHDCLYFDLNSVIHNCCHGSDPLPEGATEEDMILRIFEQVDEIIGFVQPRKLVYFAFDGVVPAGKLIQQRSRRLKTAEEQQSPDAFDANTISPGTAFMARISEALQWYIHDRSQSEVSDIAFILSDSSAPGEGEHKIIQYIKHLRTAKGYDPNTSHCICSQDADLVLLGLLLHSPHVSLLREYQEVRPPRGKRPRPREHTALKYDFLLLAVVREYLYADFKGVVASSGADFEKMLDDFVVLCSLMGNDFLPSIPSIQVREGALDELVAVYKRHFEGHFVEEGRNIDYVRLAKIIGFFAVKEVEVYAARRQSQLQRDPQGNYADTFDFTSPSYRALYAEKTGVTEETIAKDYLQGLKWVTDYYFTGNASWEWVYPHSYPPQASSLWQYCASYSAAQQHIYAGPPLTPLELLLAILPRQNNSILPEPFRKLTQAAAPLGDMYEDVHTTERIGGRLLTVTPCIDVSRVRTEARRPEVTKLLSQEEASLNSFKETLAFVNISAHPEFAPEEKLAGKKRKIDECEEEVVCSTSVTLPDFSSVCLNGVVKHHSSGVQYGEDFPLSFDLLDPVEAIETTAYVLHTPHVIPHEHAVLPGTAPPPSTLNANEAAAGSDSVFQSIVPAVFATAMH